MSTKNVNLNAEEGESQNKRLLAYLREGNSITSLESWLLLECGRLASRVNDLHNKGIPVTSVRVKRKKVLNPDGSIKKKQKKFSAYYLIEGIKNKYDINVEDIPQLVKEITERRINQE